MQKVLSLLFIVIALFLFSCRRSYDNELIKRAEQQLKIHPDSAFALLESIEEPSKLDKATFSKYITLLVEVHERNNYHLRRDTTISLAIDYYSERKDSLNLANSCLLGGMVFDKTGDYIRATKYYTDAIQLSNTIGEIDILIKSYLELGELHESNNDYDKALTNYNRALALSREKGDTDNEIRSLCYIGDIYAIRNNTDSSLILYNQAISLIPQSEENQLSNIYKNIAISHKNTQNWEMAIKAIHKSISYMDSTRISPVQYLILSDIYKSKMQLDSAKCYALKAIRSAKSHSKSKIDFRSLLFSYEALYNIEDFKAMKGNDLLSEYELAMNVSDSLAQKKRFRPLNVLSQEYELSKIQNKNQKLVIRNQQIIIIGLSSIILLSTLVLFYVKRLKSKKKQLSDIQEIVHHKDKILNDVRNSLFEQLQKYKQLTRLSFMPIRKKEEFLKDYNKFIENKDEEFAFDWDILSKLVDGIYDNYSVGIKNKFPQMTDKELQLCILLKAGFDPQDISNITQQSINTIYKRNTELRKKLFVPNAGNIISFIDNSIDNDSHIDK